MIRKHTSQKLCGIFMMLVFVLGTVLSFTSCGDDDDVPALNPGAVNSNNGSGSSSGDKWITNASVLRTVATYYVGTWYYLSEFSTFLAYQNQGYSQGMKDALHSGLEFNSNGTGNELYYRDGSSTVSKTPFTWKVLKTLRPERDVDCLYIKFQNSSADNIVILNAPMTTMSKVDRQLKTYSYEIGEDNYRDCNMWSNYVRYTGSVLRW